MKIHFYIRLMPEFLGQEINDDLKCYQIIKAEESKTGETREVRESVEQMNLNKHEANKLVYQLDPTATLAV